MLIENKETLNTKEYVIKLQVKKKKKALVFDRNFKTPIKQIEVAKLNFNLLFVFNKNNKDLKKINYNFKQYLFFNYLFLNTINKNQTINKKLYFIIQLSYHLKVINLKWFEIANLILIHNKNIYLNLIKYKTKKLYFNKNYNIFKLLFITSNINWAHFNKIILYSKKKFKFNTINIQLNFFIQKNLYMFFFNFTPSNVFDKIINSKYSILNFYTYKYIFSFLSTRKFNYLNLNLFKFFLIKFNKKNLNLLKFLLWKNNNLIKFEKYKKKINKLKRFQKKTISFSYLYYIQLIEERLDALNETNNINVTKLENLRNILFNFLEKKNKGLEIKKYLLLNPKKVKDLRLSQRKLEFKKFIKQKKNTVLTIPTLTKLSLLKKKTKKFSCKFFFKTPKVNFKARRRKRKKFKFLVLHTFKKKIKLRRWHRWKKPLNFNKFIGKRLTFNSSYFNYKYNQELISLLFGFKVNTYFINALSLTRFELHMQLEEKKKVLRNKKSSLLFINKLERDFVKRYKFIANYLQDFARVGFIALYTKDLSFLVKFIAFQIANLQKNRKETRLIKFIIKAIKVFSSQREEVIALKIQFKGRVNRWRRTKIITGKRGIIPFNTYKTHLEYATATSITRKGALGIRLWVYFDDSFSWRIEAGFKNYIKVNKILKYKKITNQIIR